MGMNSIFFVLNDFSGDIKRHPVVVSEILSRASELKSGSRNGAGNFGNPAYRAITQGTDMHPQALTAVACFHSSDRRFFMAGGNTMRELEVYDPERHGNVETVTLVVGNPAQTRK